MGFLARWLTDAITLGLALAFALAAMQVPALTHDYAAALLQVAEDARRDIGQREASARHFYNLTGDTDDSIIAALRPYEPSNAATLTVSVDRMRILRAAYDRIAAAPPLLRPVTAVLDTIADPKGYKAAVLETTLDTYSPQVVIGTAAAIYGLIGLAIGSFVAQLVISTAANLGRRRPGDRVET